MTSHKQRFGSFCVYCSFHITVTVNSSRRGSSTNVWVEILYLHVTHPKPSSMITTATIIPTTEKTNRFITTCSKIDLFVLSQFSRIIVVFIPGFTLDLCMTDTKWNHFDAMKMWIKTKPHPDNHTTYLIIRIHLMVHNVSRYWAILGLWTTDIVVLLWQLPNTV